MFQADVLNVGESALGFMFAAVGIGALAGSLGAAYFSSSAHMVSIQFACGVLFGLSLIAFALSPAYPLSLAFLVLVGITSQTYLTINRSLLMMNTDPKLFGRVTSVQIMAWYFMPVSLLPMGLIADRIGVDITVACAGLLVAALIAASYRFRGLFLSTDTPSTMEPSSPARTS